MNATEALREFVTYTIAHLIEFPEQASVAIEKDPNSELITYRISCANSDIKRIIGKQGLTISSIRSLLQAAARKHQLRVNLRIHESKED
jgi:uncharacterized protein